MTAQLTIDTFPNEAAAAYIRGKAVADPKNFGALPAQLKQRAFTVAGIEQLDALRKIRDAVAKLPEGASWDEAKKDVAEKIAAYTGVDMKAARARAELQLRVHGFQAYSVARHQEQMATIDVLPYWKYETVGDNRVRASHAALDGKVLRADDPWWRTHYPPWDWGCRCIVVALDEEDAKEIGISERRDMPTPGHSESFSFDPGNVAIDLEQYRNTERFKDDADWKMFFVTPAKRATVEAPGGERMSMWDLCLKEQTARVSRSVASQSRADAVEYFSVISRETGMVEATTKGTADEVKFNAEKLKHGDYITIHTHPNGGNMPSAADIETYRSRFDDETARGPSWDYIVAVPRNAKFAPRVRLIVTKGYIPVADLEILADINRRLRAAKESERSKIRKEYMAKLDELESRGLIEYKETKEV